MLVLVIKATPKWVPFKQRHPHVWFASATCYCRSFNFGGGDPVHPQLVFDLRCSFCLGPNGRVPTQAPDRSAGRGVFLHPIPGWGWLQGSPFRSQIRGCRRMTKPRPSSCVPACRMAARTSLSKARLCFGWGGPTNQLQQVNSASFCFILFGGRDVLQNQQTREPLVSSGQQLTGNPRAELC